ncbi:protein BOLA4, chloroplastic/mitochondrial [Ricinus communis]|uniref:Transcription regulator, putative n=1 Tax=Ricinus communis TaxID=3988 RepID=B9SDE8_RICCO|nr:protein BOLA4, chloroplastic/mitochondrial [Ricinus communis]EEF38385.1 transcription regulator, putative [Ricinus communis]|eukprot:XP_002524017.1 protein BOLA4, chloroplastic/mitochondrial [Ricinus communis]
MAKTLIWRPYIISSTRNFIQTQKRRVVSHSTIFPKKSETNLLLLSCTNNTKTKLQTESSGYNKLSKLGYGVVGNRRFSIRATHVNDAGSIDSPLMQSMEKKIKESLDADSVIVKDAYGDGRHVSIDVISSAFEGQSAVNRQRMVYKAIWEELQSTVHAVDQMTTKTPAEAAAQK